MQVEDAILPAAGMVGPLGDGPKSNDECVDPFFLICSSSCWNGISLATIDIAKNHTTRKTHHDVGMRVADYPTIQDYVGEAIMDTNASRALAFQMAGALDGLTNTFAPALADQIHRRQERGACGGQNAARLRRYWV
jgi:alkylation response protein AidB-like acyl-CoA dehydrogenase